MFDQILAEKLEDAIQRFEETWSENAHATISDLLDEYELDKDLEAIVEFIRVDIELRYTHGIEEVDLDVYLDDFPGLKNSPLHIGRIAREDFRVREYNGLPNHTSRWQHLPGIRNEVWFQGLMVAESTGTFESRLGKFQPSRDSGIDLAFQSALTDEGFRLVEEIGQGAVGRVYLATQPELADRHVVLKVVSHSMSESQKMARLQHTNIVPIYSSMQILSRSVICMPYAGRLSLANFLESVSEPSKRIGESLVSTVHARIDSTKIVPLAVRSDGTIGNENTAVRSTPAADENVALKPLQELNKLDCNHLATWIFVRLSSALAHAHARGVLHNDLKPANVLIRNDGEPALLDFNLSQSLDQPSPKEVGGTLPYMSPEIYRAFMGHKDVPEERSDIYSMGVMLFQFVTGRLPYQNPASMAAIDLDPAIQCRKHAPNWLDDDAVSPGLKSIINRCLAFAPNDRYQNAEELNADLSCEHGSLPLVHAPEPRLSKASKWIRRHPAISLAVSVAAFLGLFLVPAMFGTVAWINQMQHATAVAAANSFMSESEGTLAALLANVQRDTDASIQHGMSVLEKHGVFSPDKFKELFSDAMTQEEKQGIDDASLRHITHVGSMEFQRLMKRSQTDDMSVGDLERVDQLIATAERIQGETNSRASIFMKASRAKLVGNDALYHALTAEALATHPSTDSERFMEAIRLRMAGNNQGSIEILTDLANKTTIPSGLRWISLASSQNRNGDYEGAVKSYTQALDRYPNLSGLYLSRGNCFLRLHKGAIAESDLNKAIELQPDAIAGWILRATNRLGRFRFEEAISDLTQALEISPQNVAALLMRSNAYRRSGQLKQATRDLENAMQSDDVDVASLWTRASARRDNDPEGALEDLRKADAMDPNNRQTLTSMSRILSDDLGRNQEGLNLLRRIVEMEPDDERALVDCAVLLARLGQHAEARNLVNKALVTAERSNSYYQSACTCALNPDRQSQLDALSFLAMAIHKGYKADNLRTDPDLESIRAMPEFDAISRFYHLANLRKRRTL